MVEYSTFVFRHADVDAARALSCELLERFPFGETDGATRITALAVGDAMSVSDAMRMALECRDIDSSERLELALEMAEQVSWDDCIVLAGRWQLRAQHGSFINAPEEEEVTPATGGDNG